GDQAGFRLDYLRGCVKKNCNAEKWYTLAKGGKLKWRLHPLIHTPLKFNLAQDMVVCPTKYPMLSSSVL
ncbi:MAG: hypothetical protein OES18_25780, partial [Deltaproteobacteria bacterium]|nr:hypothetical protein [Deltaproteobacteria bacterium]